LERAAAIAAAPAGNVNPVSAPNARQQARKAESQEQCPPGRRGIVCARAAILKSPFLKLAEYLLRQVGLCRSISNPGS